MSDWKEQIHAEEVEARGAEWWAGDPDEVSDEPGFYDDGEADAAAAAFWSEVEQGRYDDDPNPYHGDYSEE